MSVLRIFALTRAFTCFGLDPFMCPKVQVDTGAIKHVLGGSDIMCRGMTSPGGRLDEDFAVGTVVVRSAPCR